MIVAMAAQSSNPRMHAWSAQAQRAHAHAERARSEPNADLAAIYEPRSKLAPKNGSMVHKLSVMGDILDGYKYR